MLHSITPGFKTVLLPPWHRPNARGPWVDRLYLFFKIKILSLSMACFVLFFLFGQLNYVERDPIHQVGPVSEQHSPATLLAPAPTPIQPQHSAPGTSPPQGAALQQRNQQPSGLSLRCHTCKTFFFFFFNTCRALIMHSCDTPPLCLSYFTKIHQS